ncbi:MAG: hypothetical protein B7Y25_05180 [Alphaproteobacteria bacterium 16-39-46]|nr:MAG: hypothetical protein B7Y25_05180 [Alphaproteobacteria bacterium 16-39-46]OZA42713.1 MAG: hypothetical protein B7X84_05090 [Alphaproteobacteria bacterium 17-39-52]HQS83614.1 hypothetical protein [Alphaproteobacteria bacterium]HQS93355.1 hypothetical protein [Alphaproteobacteria bacterium]
MKFKHPLSTVALLSSLLGVISFDANAISSLEPQASSSNTQGSQAFLDEDLLDAENPFGEALEAGNPIPNIGTSSSVSQHGFPLLPIGPTAQKATALSGSIASRKAVQNQKGPVQAAALARPDKNASSSRFSQRDSSQENPSHSYRTETPSFVKAATWGNESKSRVRTSTPQQSPAAVPQMSPQETQARALLNARGYPLTALNINAVRQLIDSLARNNGGGNPSPFVPAAVVLANRGMDITQQNVVATYYLKDGANAIENPTAPQIQHMVAARRNRLPVALYPDARILLANNPNLPIVHLEPALTALTTGQFPIANPDIFQVRELMRAIGGRLDVANGAQITPARVLLQARIPLSPRNIEATHRGLILLHGGLINPMDGIQFPFNINNATAVAVAADRQVKVNALTLDSVRQMRTVNIYAPTGQQIIDVGHRLIDLRQAGINDGTGHNFNHAVDNVKAVTRVAALQDAVNQANLRDATLALVAPAVDARHIKAAKHIGVEAPVFGAINGLAGQGRDNITLFQNLDRLNRDVAKGAALADTRPDHAPLSELWTLRGGASNNTTALTTLVANAIPAAKAAVKDNYYNTLINASKSLLRIEPNGLNRAQLFADHGIRFQTAEELEEHFELIAALAEANGEARANELREHADAVHIFVTTIKSNK